MSYNLHNSEVDGIFEILDTYGPAPAWLALEASQNIAAFPTSVVELVQRRLSDVILQPATESWETLARYRPPDMTVSDTSHDRSATHA